MAFHCIVGFFFLQLICETLAVCCKSLMILKTFVLAGSTEPFENLDLQEFCDLWERCKLSTHNRCHSNIFCWFCLVALVAFSEICDSRTGHFSVFVHVLTWFTSVFGQPLKIHTVLVTYHQAIKNMCHWLFPLPGGQCSYPVPYLALSQWQRCHRRHQQSLAGDLPLAVQLRRCHLC